MQAQAVEDEKPFADAQAAFGGLVERLQSRELLSAEHGEVERVLEEQGRELMRRLYQDHLHVRTQARVGVTQITGSDGERRSHRVTMSRNLMTVFGPVTVEREGFRGRELSALCPLDAELNLPAHLYSHGVQRRVAELCSRASFDATGQELGRTSGASVGKRQLEQMAQALSVDFDDFYAHKAAQSVAPEATLLIGGVDGTGVTMRPEGLREPTLRRRQAATVEGQDDEQRWPKPMRSRAQRRHGMRMAAVSVVYQLCPWERTPEDVLRDLRPLGAASRAAKRPRPQAKRVSASVHKSMAEVVADTFAEMQRRDPMHQRRWVVLSDGDEHQLELIGAQARAHGVEVTVVLDFIHVAQHVWDAARVLVPDDQDQRRLWVTHKLTLILLGEASTAAAAMRRSATKRRLAAEHRKPVDTCADYLLKNAAYLRYDAALREGLPITTGVVEGACRHLVKDRMNLTGARWGLQTAEAVLRLRGLDANGDLHDYLAFHQARELDRVHRSRYANNRPPHLLNPRRPQLRLVK